MRGTAPSAEQGTAPRRLRDLDPRRYDWDRAALVERDCPLCGAPAAPAAFERPDGLLVRPCARCGAWHVSPAPDAAQLARFYVDYHRRHRVAAFRGTEWEDRTALPSLDRPEELAERVRRRRPLDDLRVQVLDSLRPLRGARALDVGCGTGELAQALAALGARVVALDVDREAVAFCRDALGLDAREHDLAALPADERFELVALQDVLEHVLEPRALLDAARARLAPGGLLYLWTPNATFAGEEAEPEVFRADLEHLQFLTARTVGWLARELDLELLHLESVGYLGSGEAGHGRATRPGRRPLPAPLRALLGRLPGARRANELRLALAGRHIERSGNYHLFAVLRAPQGSWRRAPGT